MKKFVSSLIGSYLNLMSVVAPRTAARQGFSLFCRPVNTPMKHYHKRFLDTAKKSTFHHEGISVQVYKWGNGKKKLLFLHGWQSHSFRWKNYIESFSSDEYTMYAFDAPGHGASGGNFLTVPLYSSIVEKFILEQDGVDALIGHSLGAFTALYTFHRLPLLPVKKLVCLASPGNATEFIQFYQELLNLSERCIGLVRNYFYEAIKHPVEFFSVESFASSLNLPGLIIHDEEDDETSHANSVLIHQQWPKSRLLLTKGYGHNLRFPEVIEQVAGFVKEPIIHPVPEKYH